VTILRADYKSAIVELVPGLQLSLLQIFRLKAEAIWF
jgi:hypothetical protein